MQDVVQVVHAFPPFQLGHDGGAAVQLVEIGAGVAHIIAGTHKGQGYPVHSLLDAELQGDFVAFGNDRHIHSYVGQVDAFVRGQVAANQHPGIHGQVVADFQHFQAYGAVGEKDAVAGAEVA